MERTKCCNCEKEIPVFEATSTLGLCHECYWDYEDEKDMVKRYGESVLKVEESQGIKFNDVEELYELVDKIKKETGLNPIIIGDVSKLKGR